MNSGIEDSRISVAEIKNNCIYTLRKIQMFKNGTEN